MRDLETSIVQGGVHLLDSHAERLAASGMTWHGPEVEVWRSEAERYTSELRITFLKGGEICDVLEFQIYDKGQALVTTEEAMNWLTEQLEVMDRSDNQ